MSDTNELDKKNEFEKLVRPLIKFLNDNFNPHTSIIITPMTAEVLMGEIVFRTEDYLND